MNIDNVVLVSNENPTYLDWWPVVSRIWKERIGLNPILVLVTDQGGKSRPTEKYGKVIRIKPYEGLSIAGQTSLLRLWYHYNSNRINLLCDIDFIPISKYWYNDSVSKINDDKFVYINSYLYPGHNWRHFFSTNVSNGKTFRDRFNKVIGKANNYYDFINLAIKFTSENRGMYLGKFNKYWGLDEVLLSRLMTDYTEVKDKIIPTVWVREKVYDLGLVMDPKLSSNPTYVDKLLKINFTVPHKAIPPRNLLTDKLIYGNNFSRLVAISYPYKLDWFKEWLDWNIKLGFDKILIGIDTRFNSFELPKHEKVEYIEFNRDKDEQRKFYQRIISDDKYAWNACIDDDEFIVVNSNINEFITRLAYPNKVNRLMLAMIPMVSNEDNISTTPVKDCIYLDKLLNFIDSKSIIRSGNYTVDSVHSICSSVKGIHPERNATDTILDANYRYKEFLYHYHDKGVDHHEFIKSRGRAVKSNIKYTSIPDGKKVGNEDTRLRKLIYGY